MTRRKLVPLKCETTDLGTWSVSIKEITSQRGTTFNVEIGNHDGSGTYICAGSRENALLQTLAWLIARSDPDPVGSLASRLAPELRAQMGRL